MVRCNQLSAEARKAMLAMTARLTSTAFFSLFLSAALAADTVYLKNGNSFKNVVAELTDTQVRIHLPFGEIGISRDRVTRVEKSRSSYEEFLARRAVLKREIETTAADWLKLALWAQRHGLDHAFREAAIKAAELDPALEGLDSVMPRLEFVFDAVLASWIPYAEAQRRRGLVEYDGQWMTADARATRVSEGRAREASRLADARQERLARTVELLALVQLRQQTVQTREPRAPLGVTYAVPSAYVVPGFFGLPVGFVVPRVVVRVPAAVITRSKPRARRRPTHHRGTLEDLIDRQPGSLLPVGGHTRSSSSNR